MKKQNIKTAIVALVSLAIMVVVLSGCAGAINIEECLPTPPKIYGFLGGFWHGLILLFSFIGRLFNDDIAIYAINNTGAWYDFGFCLGIGGVFSGVLKI